ncbi:hypothetical protein ACFSTD_09640 [Novosphingobium colocasiae]|uniref:Uncharacterized protein n=1 Tax=Novosphingobium colocasiae TaxID=1256513 RepID=A0A918UFU3_9SPHN|nr:hypothetical protein [Novosphingobium colocasiae]GGZ02471.1 hypothetical protein GCM10011614_16920 [Novosphingobium colocasiae]
MPRAHLCDVPGCGRSRKRWQRLCDPCFKALPGDIRTALADAFKAGRGPEWRRQRRRARQHLDDLHAGSATHRATSPEAAYAAQARLLGEHD